MDPDAPLFFPSTPFPRTRLFKCASAASVVIANRDAVIFAPTAGPPDLATGIRLEGHFFRLSIISSSCSGVISIVFLLSLWHAPNRFAKCRKLRSGRSMPLSARSENHIAGVLARSSIGGRVVTGARPSALPCWPEEIHRRRFPEAGVTHLL